MAAAAFCEREGEGEATGLVAAAASAMVTEWKAEERFGPLCGYSFVLKQATDRGVMELTAMPESATGLMFRAQFDADALVSAGFVGSVDFDSRLKMLRGALSGDAAVTTTVTAHSSDAIDVNITVPVADYFSLHIKLTLGCAPLDKTQVLKAQLSTSAAECESLKLRLTAAKTEMKEASDTAQKQLADAKIETQQLKAELDVCRKRLKALEKALSEKSGVKAKPKRKYASRSGDHCTPSSPPSASSGCSALVAYCDCGEEMNRCRADQPYAYGMGVSCNNCSVGVWGSSEIYHCPLDDQCPAARTGFDLCLSCAVQRTYK